VPKTSSFKIESCPERILMPEREPVRSKGRPDKKRSSREWWARFEGNHESLGHPESLECHDSDSRGISIRAQWRAEDLDDKCDIVSRPVNVTSWKPERQTLPKISAFQAELKKSEIEDLDQVRQFVCF
jgi:hypothetical protein